jgi:hyperosmotically inducible protein
MTTRRQATALLTLMTAGAILAASTRSPAHQTTVAEGERVLQVRRALERLPYYGVFDFIAYRVEKGTVMLFGFAYRGDLPSAAETAVKRVAGIDEVQNKIEPLPASQNDDRIRWATFYNIYTDDFLSRYAPGGPIHIIVRGGRITLVGVVDNEGDKTIAGVRAREVPQVFGVENELMISKK